MRKSRLPWVIQRRLIEHFVSGSTGRTAASLVGVNKSTAAFYSVPFDLRSASLTSRSVGGWSAVEFSIASQPIHGSISG